MAKVFVDTSWNPKKRKSKKHVCYDPERDVFFEVNDLRELSADYNEIYLDSSIFPNMWPQLKPLVNDGRRVYYFARSWKWKEIRERFREDLKLKTGKVSKTDKGDAFLLYKIYELSLMKGNTNKYFRQLTMIDVELRPLLMKEQIIFRNFQRVQRMGEFGIDVSEDVGEFEKKLENVRGEVVGGVLG